MEALCLFITVTFNKCAFPYPFMIFSTCPFTFLERKATNFQKERNGGGGEVCNCIHRKMLKSSLKRRKILKRGRKIYFGLATNINNIKILF